MNTLGVALCCWVLAFSVTVTVASEEAAVCPDGREQGDQWTVKENCTLCMCDNNKVTCEGCKSSGAYSLQLLRVPKDCYPTSGTPTSDYFPACCKNTMTALCKGKPGFNEDLLTYFNSLTRQRKK